jgi:phosphomannomutase
VATAVDVAGPDRVVYRRVRGVDVAAPPTAVWPWLVQMGFDRGGWYAVDALEKAFGVGRFATGWSARRIEPSLQTLAVGDRVPLSRSRLLEVAVLEAPHELKLVLPPGPLRWTWRFLLAPRDGGSASHLTIETLLSLPARSGPGRAAVRLAWAAFDPGHGVMEAVQLRTIARRSAAAWLASDGPLRPPEEPRMPDDLRARAAAWAAGDPDPATRSELAAILANPATTDADLTELVGSSLQFGTAGLRGRVGPGPNRMNRAVVIRTTRGLADHLLATDPTARGRGVVVGFDARRDSARFAADVCGVLAAAGFTVHRFPTHQPTPLCAFAQKDLDAAAAVVVTASHNPPDDNGYKVYVEGAAQIVPPTDAAIAAAIDAVGPAVEVPRVPADELVDHPAVRGLGGDVAARYRAALPAARPATSAAAAATPLRIAYTPLHGVGRDLLLRALADAGHTDVHVAPSQAEPDGGFPTVAFPNPEEPGALDAVLALAAEVDADLVLANDPDADRLAVAVPDGNGGFTVLTGNRIGVLLAEHCLAGRADAVRAAGRTPLVVSSIVSTPMVAAVAAAHGARSEVTLTGFKWICAAARALEPEGFELVHGFEEALGTTVGTVVADKDGISAAVAFADLARGLAAEGRGVLDLLADLQRRHGLWRSGQRSVTHVGVEGQRRIAAAMTRLGDAPPSELAGAPVRSVTDFRTGAEHRPPWLGLHDLVAFELDEGRVMVRPSGTEPKAKVYVDVRAEVAPDADAAALAATEERLAARVAELADAAVAVAGL